MKLQSTKDITVIQALVKPLIADIEQVDNNIKRLTLIDPTTSRPVLVLSADWSTLACAVPATEKVNIHRASFDFFGQEHSFESENSVEVDVWAADVESRVPGAEVKRGLREVTRIANEIQP